MISLQWRWTRPAIFASRAEHKIYDLASISFFFLFWGPNSHGMGYCLWLSPLFFYFSKCTCYTTFSLTHLHHWPKYLAAGLCTFVFCDASESNDIDSKYLSPTIFAWILVASSEFRYFPTPMREILAILLGCCISFHYPSARVSRMCYRKTTTKKTLKELQ